MPSPVPYKLEEVELAVQDNMSCIVYREQVTGFESTGNGSVVLLLTGVYSGPGAITLKRDLYSG